MAPCKVCKGTGRDPMSDNLNWLPCGHCGGSGQEPERKTAPTFDALWNLYIGADVTPAEWAAPGWDMARILAELRAEEMTGPEMMEAANVIAAGLEELGLPLTHEVDTLTLTTTHAASSYGRPVLVIDGEAFGPADMTPAGVTAAELLGQWAARFTGQRVEEA